MGGGGGGGVGWVGHGQGVIGAHTARHKAREAMLDATEGVMEQDGITPPARPMSQRAVFGWGFACGLSLGLLIGLIFWELT